MAPRMTGDTALCHRCHLYYIFSCQRTSGSLHKTNMSGKSGKPNPFEMAVLAGLQQRHASNAFSVLRQGGLFC